MPLFPQLGPTYLEDDQKGVRSRMEAFYSQALGINQSFWGEADLDNRFFAGDQTLWNNLYGNLPVNQRRQFMFNRIRPVINLISGHQRKNRKSTIVTPVENADNQTADQFSKVMIWANGQDNVLETISTAFQGALISGMNMLHVWLDYRNDPVSGNIRVDNCAYNTFLIDPYFRKPDLSDCNAIWKRDYLTKQQCISLMPDHTEEILNLNVGNQRDGKFQFMPENYNWDLYNLLTYDHFYYRDYRRQKMMLDTITGETLEWKGKDEEDLKRFLQIWPQVTMVEQEVPTVRLAIVIQGKVFYDGPNPLGTDHYPFVPVLGYYAPEMPYLPWRIQGVVRGMRDAQYLYNRRKVIELDILESQINSGWVYKENALVNPKDVFLSGQGRGLALKDEAMMTDVQQIQSPRIDPSVITLSDILAKELTQISGVNEELLGSAIDDKAGVLSMLRQGAGLTTLQTVFDQLDLAQKLLGKLFIDIIQTNWVPGKIKRILEGEEPSPQFYNKAFGKYDAVVEEGLNTSTQRQMQFAQLLQLRELGVQIPDHVLIDAATIQDKKKLMDAVQQQQQQAAQMQQQQAQAALQEQAARTDLAHARAQADRGLGIERASRVEENQALALERRAAAIKDQDAALLDLVKAIKEIEHLDMAHLKSMIETANMIKMAENQGQNNQEMVENRS